MTVVAGTHLYSTCICQWYVQEERSNMYLQNISVLCSMAGRVETSTLMAFSLLIRRRPRLDFIIVYAGCPQWVRKVLMMLANTLFKYSTYKKYMERCPWMLPLLAVVVWQPKSFLPPFLPCFVVCNSHRCNLSKVTCFYDTLRFHVPSNI